MDTAFRSGTSGRGIQCPACHQFQPLKFKQLNGIGTTRPSPKANGGSTPWRRRSGWLRRLRASDQAHASHRQWIRTIGTSALQIRTPRGRESATPGTPCCRTGSNGGRSWMSSCPRSMPCAWTGTSNPCSPSSPKRSVNRGKATTVVATGDDYHKKRKADYDFGDPWPSREDPDRSQRTDRHEGASTTSGSAGCSDPGCASRLVSYGRCNTTSELEEIRKQLNVPVVNAMIDTGFKASEVYRFCMATGWKAMKGG